MRRCDLSCRNRTSSQVLCLVGLSFFEAQLVGHSYKLLYINVRLISKVVGYGVAKGTDVVAPFPSMPILKPAADDH